jgi:signal peptidase II
MLIVTGLLSNLIDRIFRGYVVDFIDFKFWPVFNVADSLITIGVVWLGITILFDKDDEKKTLKQKTARKTKRKRISSE